MRCKIINPRKDLAMGHSNKQLPSRKYPMQNPIQYSHIAKLKCLTCICAVSAMLMLSGCGGGGSGEAVPANTNTVVQAAPNVPSTCAQTNAKIGQVAKLSTRAHKVSGQAKIIDNCTIEISNFNYDGGGLSKVFVYAGKGGDYINGFPIGINLKGTVYSNQTLTISLQPGDLDKLDGISVWCTDANANFGDGSFAAI
jgi:hypothetical protein